MKLKPIKDKKRIDAIFNRGVFISGRRLSVKFLKFDSGGGFYGISVSKKIFPLAVTRNLIKRRVRSQLRSLDLTNIASNNVSFFLIFFAVREVGREYRCCDLGLPVLNTQTSCIPEYPPPPVHPPSTNSFDKFR